MLIRGLLGHGVALPKNSDIAELQCADEVVFNSFGFV